MKKQKNLFDKFCQKKHTLTECLFTVNFSFKTLFFTVCEKKLNGLLISCIYFFVLILIFYFIHNLNVDFNLRIVNENSEHFYPGTKINQSFIQGKLHFYSPKSWVPIQPLSIDQLELSIICKSFNFLSGYLVPMNKSKIYSSVAVYYDLKCPENISDVKYCYVEKFFIPDYQ